MDEGAKTQGRRRTFKVTHVVRRNHSEALRIQPIRPFLLLHHTPLKLPTIKLLLLKCRGCRDGSAAESVSCYCRGPCYCKISSQGAWQVAHILLDYQFQRTSHPVLPSFRHLYWQMHRLTHSHMTDDSKQNKTKQNLIQDIKVVKGKQNENVEVKQTFWLGNG